MVTTAQALVSAVLAIFLYQWYQFYRTRSKIDHIPTLGSDNFFGSYIDLLKFMFKDGDRLMKEGYRKFPDGLFKIRNPFPASGWFIVVTGDKMIEELRRAPSDVLSKVEATVDQLEMDYLVSKHARINEYHVGVVRTPLTRALNGRFGDLRDELTVACQKYLPAGLNGWEELKSTHPNFIHIVTQTSSRLFVGLPLCRNKEYLDIQENWTIYLFGGSLVLHMLPDFLKPIAARSMSKVKSSVKRIEEMLGPTILQRIEKTAAMAASDDVWEDKPSDMIQWLIDLAPPELRNVEDVVIRLMFINIAAIHTTSLTVSNVLFHLAARKEYHEPLRAEMEECIRAHGWTKEAMGRMQKLDSFIKEAMRHSGMSNFSAHTKVTKDFAFSNGITVPAGFSIVVASQGIHFDPEHYDDPTTFDGYRFYNLAQAAMNADSKAEKTGTEQWKNQAVSLDKSWYMFGHGRHACPGRFFAINETKALLTHILLSYDIKLPGDATEPEHGAWFAGLRQPTPTAGILFRKRAT